jgi:deoxyribodipyrimidine photo-lyase
VEPARHTGNDTAVPDDAQHVVVHWLRRDLRLDDNPALAAAVSSGAAVASAFVLDPRLLDGECAAPARVGFLLEGLADLDARLRRRGGGLVVRSGESEREIAALAAELGAAEVHACADDEPFARRRDRRARQLLAAAGARLVLHDDLTAVPHTRVRTLAGGVCRTYAGYVRAVDRALAGGTPPVEPLEPGARLRPAPPPALPRARTRSELVGGETAALARLRSWRDGDGLALYAERRDRLSEPAVTSRLSPYLKLGMLSPRRCVQAAGREPAGRWRAELLWRDWFKYVLHHHPDLAERCVDRRFDALEWPGGDREFAAWCRGETGFGLVDAGMRQLAATGFLPNRARMVCASFLVKTLHVDWRRGECWFREHLVDGDLAANAGGFQWVAGTGLDAAPYHRIFNPERQRERFDPDGAYVARWAPDRPAPIVDLRVERQRALDLYRAALR